MAVSGRPKCECHALPLQFNFLPVYSYEGIICIDDKLKGQNRDKYNDLFSSLVNIHRYWTKMLNDGKQQVTNECLVFLFMVTKETGIICHDDNNPGQNRNLSRNKQGMLDLMFINKQDHNRNKLL